jgi:hypothetical protein
MWIATAVLRLTFGSEVSTWKFFADMVSPFPWWYSPDLEIAVLGEVELSRPHLSDNGVTRTLAASGLTSKVVLTL